MKPGQLSFRSALDQPITTMGGAADILPETMSSLLRTAAKDGARVNSLHDRTTKRFGWRAATV